MSFSQSFVSSNTDVEVKTEKIKVLRVIGEKIAQIVVEGSLSISNAARIDRINAEIIDTVDRVFKNKIVKQGTIRKHIYYVDLTGTVRYIKEEIPFMVTVDICGVDPDNCFLEIQNHLLDIATDFTFVQPTGTIQGILSQKVVANVLVKASEWTQLDVVTKVDIFPKLNSLTKCHR